LQKLFIKSSKNNFYNEKTEKSIFQNVAILCKQTALLLQVKQHNKTKYEIAPILKNPFFEVSLVKEIF